MDSLLDKGGKLDLQKSGGELDLQRSGNMLDLSAGAKKDRSLLDRT